MRALSSIDNVEVRVIADEDISQERRLMGWHSVDYGDAEVIVAPTPTQRQGLLRASRTADAHLFSGLGSYAGTNRSFTDLIRGHRNHVSILTESWEPVGLRGILRNAKYRLLARRYAAAIDSVFTIGGLARQQFVDVGIPAQKVWPFGYFVGKSDVTRIPMDSSPFSVLFVGSMNAGKQPYRILEAMRELRGFDWKLDFIGDGPESARIRSRAEEEGLSQKVSTFSFRPNDEIRQKMANSDLLVLPSSYDGWGAVVNEALQVGTRVAVSRDAGASELVRGELQGWTFSAKSTPELTSVISRAKAVIGKGEEDRKRLIDWSDYAISPKSGADYLLRVIGGAPGGPRVTMAPWLD
jgi:glycosyltransferase involved in cell wall biosynthesis